MSTEEKTVKPGFINLEAKVGDATIGDLLGALMFALEQRRASGDARLGDLTTEEFTARMLDIFRSRAFAGAAQETAIAEQVLQDWQGLMRVNAVAQPFRVANEKDAQEMAQSLVQSLAGGLKGHFVVAVGIVNQDKTYAPYTPEPVPVQPVYNRPAEKKA